MDSNQQIDVRSILIILSLFLISPSNSIAASFDCSKATTKAEKMVCANPELSRLDESLSRAYRVVQKRYGKAAALDQREWLLLRDECSTKSCLKSLYEDRIKVVESPGYVARLRGTGAGRRAPSYFSETPISPIDLMMQGCFDNQECASYAESLIPRFSETTSGDENDVRERLKHCTANQRNINICVGFLVFVLENEFADVLSEAIKPAGKRCEIAMAKRQDTWASQTYSKCDHEAFEQTGQGTAYGSVFGSCIADMYRQRIPALRSLGTCEPCSKCLNLP